MSGEPLNHKIIEFTNALRPKIEHFLTNPRFPFWHPPQSAGDNAQKFYNDLEIPLVKGKPSILLHDLGIIHNLYVDPIFEGDQHRYALSALVVDVVNGY